MYLNGNRLKAAAKLRHLSQDELQKRSKIDPDNMAYYWSHPTTVISQDDLDALAKALQIAKSDVLLVKGVPKEVALRDDKFSTE